jgi:twitching motility two-component system response regulator PilH
VSIIGRLNRLLGKAETTPAEAAGLRKGGHIARIDRRRQNRVDARTGTRVLIIDDSPTIIAALRKFLRTAGYQTFEALDAENGIEVARREKPELVFLDIVLPGMNGFAALRTLRRDPDLREIPVIMMSGNEQATEQFFGSRIGADDFMKKPFSREEVFARIVRLLDEERIPRRPAIAVRDALEGGTPAEA